MKLVLCLLLFVFAANLQAVDVRKIVPLVVHVTDLAGAPVGGALIELPAEEIARLREEVPVGVFASFEKLLMQPSRTDQLGYAIVYYHGGIASERESYSFSLPSSVAVSAIGFQTTKVDMARREGVSIKPAESVALIVEVVLERKDK